MQRSACALALGATLAIVLAAPGATAGPLLDDLVDPVTRALPPPSGSVADFARERAEGALAVLVDEAMDARDRAEGRLVSHCERLEREAQPFLYCPLFLP